MGSGGFVHNLRAHRAARIAGAGLVEAVLATGCMTALMAGDEAALAD